jgi:hypothetical protein
MKIDFYAYFNPFKTQLANVANFAGDQSKKRPVVTSASAIGLIVLSLGGYVLTSKQRIEKTKQLFKSPIAWIFSFFSKKSPKKEEKDNSQNPPNLQQKTRVESNEDLSHRSFIPETDAPLFEEGKVEDLTVEENMNTVEKKTVKEKKISLLKTIHANAKAKEKLTTNLQDLFNTHTPDVDGNLSIGKKTFNKKDLDALKEKLEKKEPETLIDLDTVDSQLNAIKQPKVKSASQVVEKKEQNVDQLLQDLCEEMGWEFE